MAAKKTHIASREQWDWSLSNCELGRRYGLTPTSVHLTRSKLGIPAFKSKRKDPLLGVDRSHVKNPPVPLSGIMFKKDSIAEFERNMGKGSDDECWPWLALCDSRPGAEYGKAYMRFNGGGHRQLQAHRVSHAIFKGEVPPGKLVMHSCDNKKCVNPKHLSIGNDLDNSRDASMKGLMHPGVKTYGAVLNDETVRQIRIRFSRGERKNDIARSIGHHRRTVADVVNNKTWRHVK